MQITAEQVRALRDEDFRLTRAQGQEHPAGDPVSEVYVTATALNNTCEGWSSCGRVCSY
ncbi:hypothetical protein ACFW1A_18130 [Kitasatospora sp. NPDC058965]|uniref:hypothetical protein n=1 Tax=Kitasatospora sp. NPDC058965 TaxID=3346682 RepID=UPI0036B4772A